MPAVPSSTRTRRWPLRRPLLSPRPHERFLRPGRPFSLTAAGSRAARSPWTSSNSARETATQLPLPSAAALAQRAVAPPAALFPLLLRSPLVHFLAPAVVLLLCHEDSYLRRKDLSTLGS